MNRDSRKEAGQNLVEFAFGASIMLILILFLLDGARILWNYASLSNLARQGARYASVHSALSASPVTVTDITNYVKGKTVGIDKNSLQVAASWPNGNAPGPDKRVVVVLTYTTSSVVSLFWSGNITLVSSSSMIMQN